MRKLSIALPLLATLGCMGLFQSYEEGVRVICDSPNTCTDCADASPDMRMQLIARHIDQSLGNDEAIALMDSLATMPPKDRVDALRRASLETGSMKCPLSEMWQSQMREEWTRSVEELCALSSTCQSFDASEPSSVITCAANLDGPAAEEVARMDRSSSIALGNAIQALAAKHGQPACAVAASLRNP